LSAGLFHTECYALQFWSKLHTDVHIFEQLSEINESLEECDFMSVRDLYRKVKMVLSQDNSERVFGLKDTKLLLDLH
jgi:hypothetical protein